MSFINYPRGVLTSEPEVLQMVGNSLLNRFIRADLNPTGKEDGALPAELQVPVELLSVHAATGLFQPRRQRRLCQLPGTELRGWGSIPSLSSSCR